MTTTVPERLSPAHLAWLKEFSVVMHRRYAYPPKHPSRVAAEEVAFRALSQVLEQQPEIIVAVTERQVAIGGGYSDPKNPALGELAERLHRQGIGAITIREGVSPEEFDALLTRIAEAKPRSPEDEVGEEKQPGEHVAVEMMSYEGLALSEELDDDGKGPDATGDRLWRELAELAVAGWDGFDDSGSGGGGLATEGDATRERQSGAVPAESAEEGPGTGAAPARRSGMYGAIGRTTELPAALSPANVAKMISARARDPRHAAGILKGLLKVGRYSRRRGRAGSGAVAARLREVLAQIEPGTMAALLETEADPVRQRLLVLQGVDALPVSAVIDWIEAAAKTSDHNISHYLMRLLKKLAAHTRRRRDGGPDEGGESLREAARQLIEDWNLDLGETEAHGSLLEKIASYEETTAAREPAELAGAERIMQMVLESDVYGVDVTAAVDRLIDDKCLGALLALLEGARNSAVARPAVYEHLTSAETIRRVLLSEPVEIEGARQLLERCHAQHAEAMLDALAISESEATRRLILDRVREIGEGARDQMVARLEGSPWYVQRNLLSLLGELSSPPAGLAFDSYLKHEQPMVRVEAVKLAARIPVRREAAINDALGDADVRVLRAALDAAHRHGLPRRSAGRLLQLLEKSEHGSDVHTRAIPVLSQVALPAARDWLLQQLLRKRGFFRRLDLTKKSPEMLAALRVLAIRWAKDPAAAAVFRLAAKSGDAQIVEAASAREER